MAHLLVGKFQVSVQTAQWYCLVSRQLLDYTGGEGLLGRTGSDENLRRKLGVTSDQR